MKTVLAFTIVYFLLYIDKNKKSLRTQKIKLRVWLIKMRKKMEEVWKLHFTLYFKKIKISYNVHYICTIQYYRTLRRTLYHKNHSPFWKLMRGKHLIFHGLFKTGFGHFTLMNDIGIIAITLLITIYCVYTCFFYVNIIISLV